MLQGATPLIMACMGGNHDTAELLLSHGADVHAADAHVSFLLQGFFIFCALFFFFL